jgi:hypothetical protein
MALRMHAEREQLFGARDDARMVAVEPSAQLATQQSLFSRAPDAAEFCFKYVPLSDESQFFPIVLPDGSLTHLKTRSHLQAATESNPIFAVNKSKCLLSRSMQEIIKEAESIQVQAAMDASKDAPHPTAAPPTPSIYSSKSQDSLWVEKYAPRSFSQVFVIRLQ